MVQIRTLERVMKNAGIPKKKVELVISEVSKPKRQPAPEPPEGAISQSDGARKYCLPQTTISTWVSDGHLDVVLRTNKQVYVDEQQLANLARLRAKKPGRGRRPISKYFQTEPS